MNIWAGEARAGARGRCVPVRSGPGPAAGRLLASSPLLHARGRPAPGLPDQTARPRRGLAGSPPPAPSPRPSGVRNGVSLARDRRCVGKFWGLGSNG